MRTLTPLRLSRSPLVLVLAQVKISTVLQMSEFLPKIQERLRRQDLPMFRVSRTQEILLAPKPIVGSHDRWLFSNKELTRTVVLAPDFVVLVASAYTVFEDFAEVLRSVLEVVGAETQVALSDRLGLRYVDLIRLAEGESFDQYLHPGLAGVPPETLGAKKVLRQDQIQAETEMGTLLVRLWQTDDGSFLPPDLQGGDVKLTLAAPSPGEIVTILDIDHFSVRQRDFSVDHLIEDMWRLHDGSDHAFRAIATDFARARWGAETG
jgi:uncharacterized protein (TIGR04255 family)